MQLWVLEAYINELKRIDYPTGRIHILPINCKVHWESDIEIQTSSGKKLLSQENGKLSLDVILERVPLKRLQKVGIDHKLWYGSPALLKTIPNRKAF